MIAKNELISLKHLMNKKNREQLQIYKRIQTEIKKIKIAVY